MLEQIKELMEKFIDVNKSALVDSGVQKVPIMGTVAMILRGALEESTLRDVDLLWPKAEGTMLRLPSEEPFIDVVPGTLECLISEEAYSRATKWFEHEGIEITYLTLEDIICSLVSGYRLEKHRNRTASLMARDDVDKTKLLEYLREAIAMDYSNNPVRDYWYRKNFNAFVLEYYPGESPVVELDSPAG